MLLFCAFATFFRTLWHSTIICMQFWWEKITMHRNVWNWQSSLLGFSGTRVVVPGSSWECVVGRGEAGRSVGAGASESRKSQICVLDWRQFDQAVMNCVFFSFCCAALQFWSDQSFPFSTLNKNWITNNIQFEVLSSCMAMRGISLLPVSSDVRYETPVTSKTGVVIGEVWRPVGTCASERVKSQWILMRRCKYQMKMLESTKVKCPNLSDTTMRN